MLSESIYHLRKNAGLSQAELAEQLGVTKQCISNWENDNVQPSIDMLTKVATYFSVSTDYLLGLTEKKYIEVSGLTDKQLSHVQQIVADIRGRNKLLK